MMPAYRNMDSYPFQRNQIPFPYYHHPSIEAVPPQMRMDPTKSPLPCEQPWPYAGNYGHSIPAYFCCGHSNFPGCCSYRPYPHAPALSSMYYSGGYPAYGEPFFVPYSPQSHYAMELPRYEYDKYVPKEHHCCGCPNHPCDKKEGKSVKIEDHEPAVGKKENDAMVPVQFWNYPYPLFWIPQDYYGNRQLKNPTTAEVGEQDMMFHDKKRPGPENSNADAQRAQKPRVLWNGWLPFDMKGAPNMAYNGEGIRSQNGEADNNRGESEDGRMDQTHRSDHNEFLFPMMWLPYYNEQEEGGRTNNQKSNSTPEYIEEVPHTFKSFPVKSCVDDGVAKKSNEVESTDTRASDDTGKVNNQRSIPVKQMELHQGKNDYEGSEKRETNVSVNKMEENVMKENSHSSSTRGSTSPRNGSKLPPVCLRVDPPPRKKNGNGSSRSPSPPASKEHSHSKAIAGETNKTPSSAMHEKVKPNSNLNSQNTPNTGEKVRPKVRTIQVSDNKTSEKKGAECSNESQSQTNMPSGVSTLTREIYKDGDRYKIEREEKRIESMTGEAAEHSVKDTSKQNEGGKKEGRVLLAADAAVLIQAAYRGYQVRKWEPLKKLKQIAEVSKEVTIVRSRIQAFEGSSDLQNDEKEKVAIGETIMRLLLKLDTIQGLHPSLREIRKSLARELVTLQEKLDSIMAKKPQQNMTDFDVQKAVEVPLLNTQNGEYRQEQQEEKVAVAEDLFEGTSDGSHDTSEKYQDQFCVKDSNNNPAPNDGGSESQSHNDPVSNEGTEPIVLPNGSVNEDTSPVVTVAALDTTSNLCETDKTTVECDAKSKATDISIEVDKLDTTALKELPVGVIDEDIIDVGSENKQKDGLDSDIHAVMELPVGVLDEDMATSEFGKDVETNISKREAQVANEVLIEVLPVGLLDEDTENSEVLSAAGKKCNANERTESSTDGNAKETQLEQSLLLEQEEVQSSGESDGWVKIELPKEDEFKGDASLDIEESGEGIGNDTKLTSLTTKVTDPDQGNEEVCLEANDVANILPERKEFVQEPEEKLAQQETHVDEDLPERKESEEKLAQQETHVDEDTQPLEKVEVEKSEDLAVAEHDGKLNGDMKLLEENDKLRKLMKELLEAGNEQLSVISTLTGKVKDLEKKLARTRRSKRVSTKRNRSVGSKMSCSTNSSE